MNSSYVLLMIGHKSFKTGKIIIVELPSSYTFIHTYVEFAKKKACNKLGLNEKETSILDYRFLGEDITFIK